MSGGRLTAPHAPVHGQHGAQLLLAQRLLLADHIHLRGQSRVGEMRDARGGGEGGGELPARGMRWLHGKTESTANSTARQRLLTSATSTLAQAGTLISKISASRCSSGCLRSCFRKHGGCLEAWRRRPLTTKPKPSRFWPPAPRTCTLCPTMSALRRPLIMIFSRTCMGGGTKRQAAGGERWQVSAAVLPTAFGAPRRPHSTPPPPHSLARLLPLLGVQQVRAAPLQLLAHRGVHLRGMAMT